MEWLSFPYSIRWWRKWISPRKLHNKNLEKNRLGSAFPYSDGVVAWSCFRVSCTSWIAVCRLGGVASPSSGSYKIGNQWRIRIPIYTLCFSVPPADQGKSSICITGGKMVIVTWSSGYLPGNIHCSACMRMVYCMRMTLQALILLTQNARFFYEGCRVAAWRTEKQGKTPSRYLVDLVLQDKK